MEKIAIIGAGSSGITALKSLRQRGLDAVCFEASDRVGGNWVYHNRNGMSACYRSLHINTSRQQMAYSDFPMPDSYPDYPGHRQIASYFDNYVDHFQLRDHIRFNSQVERAELDNDGHWLLTLADGRQERFTALLVANGHHWDPRWPEPAFPGSDQFQGIQMHAHSYDNADFLEDKNVVVVGFGNSATDIASEASYLAENVYLSVRRGAYVIPKYLYGKPTDHWAAKANPRIPFPVRRLAFEKLINSYVGDITSYGLPQPDHRFGQAHPTISATILDMIGNGSVQVKPNIAELGQNQVIFTDGSAVDADIIIYCTGYKISFPFFDQELIAAPNNEIDLYGFVFHPTINNLFFIGLVQPLGAVMPIAERQSIWVADYLQGLYRLPSHKEMMAEIKASREAMRHRYVASKRHTIQVDFNDYLYWISKERRRGGLRLGQKASYAN